MTDEELAAIRARWFTASEHGPELMRPPTQAEMALDVHILLAEIERLRQCLADTERALMREQLSNQDIAELVDTDATRERDTLWSENAALREIVQAVANGHIVSWHQNWISQSDEFLPRVNAIEIEERIYQQARALLANETTN